MNSHVIGLDELLNDLEVTEDNIDNCIDEIAKETATMIHTESIDNVSGPMNPNWTRLKSSRGNSSRSSTKFISSLKRNSFKILNKNKLSEQPYPVSVNTGTLRRSLKLKRIVKGKYMIYADANIANYAYWVHEGTSKMAARPFLDDAVEKVLNDGEYLNIAANIVEKAIDI